LVEAGTANALELVANQLGQDLVLHGVVGDLGALDIHVDRIAIDRRLGFLAELELCGPAATAAADMAGRGGGQGNAASLRPSGQGILHGSREVEIARLVIGRIGIGDIRGQHLMTLRAQIQGLTVNRYVLFEICHHSLQSSVFKSTLRATPLAKPFAGHFWPGRQGNRQNLPQGMARPTASQAKWPHAASLPLPHLDPVLRYRTPRG
jgi:hypothetical protein